MNPKEKIRQSRLSAKADIDAAIKKHGFDAVRWVVNKRSQEVGLRKQLAKEKAALNERIRQITRKLKK